MSLYPDFKTTSACSYPLMLCGYKYKYNSIYGICLYFIIISCLLTLTHTDGQSKMDNAEKVSTQSTQDDDKHNNNMCWTPLHANKHK